MSFITDMVIILACLYLFMATLGFWFAFFMIFLKFLSFLEGWGRIAWARIKRGTNPSNKTEIK